jgi:hypothetical protein
MRTRLKATANKDGTVTVTDIVARPVSVARSTCRACGLGHLESVLSLGDQYLVNFVPVVDHSLPSAPLDLVRCEGCGLLQLRDTVNRELIYRDYWYRSSVNQTMRDALKDVVKTGTRYHTAGRWLDIGANDGFLLSVVPPDFTRIACEPAHTFTEALRGIADHVIPDFFSADHDCLRGVGSHGACDVITSAAMFYDVDDPDRFVGDIAKTLSPHGVWINQLNDSPTMLKQNAFDSVCHEHLCYYDVHALNALYHRHGLSILEVTYNDVNGGSIRVVAEKPSDRARPANLHDHRTVSRQDAENFSSRVGKWRTRMREQLEGPLSVGGALWAYGASTKGSVLLQYLDMPGAIKAIADRNPAKFGTYMAGTWLPVMPEQDMRNEKPRFLMVLPWAFAPEFIARERELLDSGTTMVLPLPDIRMVL